jgi:hypothetical protein
MRRNPLVKWVFGGGLAVCLLAIAIGILIPGEMKVIFFMALALAMLVVYPLALSRALKPTPVSVALYADESGVYADDLPLVLRQDIAHAYIRPSYDERVTRHTSYGGVLGYSTYRMTLPSYPLTVELVRRRGGQINIAPGNERAAGEILAALGFPVAMCAPDYRAPTSGRQWLITVLVVALFLAALYGFSIYKSTGH